MTFVCNENDFKRVLQEIRTEFTDSDHDRIIQALPAKAFARLEEKSAALLAKLDQLVRIHPRLKIEICGAALENVAWPNVTASDGRDGPQCTQMLHNQRLSEALATVFDWVADHSTETREKLTEELKLAQEAYIVAQRNEMDASGEVARLSKLLDALTPAR